MKLWVSVVLLALAGVAVPPRLHAQIAPAQLFGQTPGETAGDPAPPPDFDLGEWSDEAPPPSRGRVCRKMCANDFSPCDPIYFKTEDGRCDGIEDFR